MSIKHFSLVGLILLFSCCLCSANEYKIITDNDSPPPFCRSKEDQNNPIAIYEYKGVLYRCNCTMGQSSTCSRIKDDNGQLNEEIQPIPLLGGNIERINPIIHDKCIVGGFTNDIYVDGNIAALHLEGNEQYQVYNFVNSNVTVQTGNKPYLDAYGYFVDVAGFSSEDSYVAYSSTWNAVPREAVIIQPETKHYAIAGEILHDRGFYETKPNIEHVYTVDLENDGVEELFITARQPESSYCCYDEQVDMKKYSSCCHEGFDGIPIDYSFVVMEKTDQGKKTYYMLDYYFYDENSYPNGNDGYGHKTSPNPWPENDTVNPNYTSGSSSGFSFYRIGGFFDIDNDGFLEIIISESSWEYFGVDVISVKEGKVEKKFSGGCGL